MAAELLTRAVANRPADSAQHGWLASRLANALYRIGDSSAAEKVANRALEHTEPDLLVDLHWTLAQCPCWPGSPRSPWPRWTGRWPHRVSARHRARLLVLAGRTHNLPGEVEEADGSPPGARGGHGGGRQLGHGLAFMCCEVAAVRGQRPTRCRCTTGRCREPVRSGPDRSAAPLPINQAVTLGSLDQNERALRRGRGGPGSRGPARYDDPAGSGPRRPGPVALRNGPMGRRAGRAGNRA